MTVTGSLDVYTKMSYSTREELLGIMMIRIKRSSTSARQVGYTTAVVGRRAPFLHYLSGRYWVVIPNSG